MNIIKRGLILLSYLTTFSVMAQNYPNSTITLIVPFAAGSGTDAVARVVSTKLGAILGQTVIVDNKPGASAQIGAQAVAAAKPDGYTLLMTTNTSHSANPWLFQTLKYDPMKDFTPIARVGELPFVLCVNNDLPVKDLQELIDYAKANPGKLSYGTPNSTSLVTSETINYLAKIGMTQIPYKSSPQAMTDLIGNQIQVYVADTGSGMGMIKSGKVRAIGLTGNRPYAQLPNVPTIAKTLPGFDLVSWNGVFGPANLPKPIVEKLNGAILESLKDAEVQSKLALLGFVVWPSKNPQDFSQYVSEQLAYWGKLIHQSGIKSELN
jgi:tripartite-type tricarboxylate transporter receptor subunit TctC